MIIWRLIIKISHYFLKKKKFQPRETTPFSSKKKKKKEENLLPQTPFPYVRFLYNPPQANVSISQQTLSRASPILFRLVFNFTSIYNFPASFTMLHRSLLVSLSSFRFFCYGNFIQNCCAFIKCICYVMLGSTFREGKIDSRAIKLIHMFGCFRV